MLVTSIFSFSHNVFYPIQKRISILMLHKFWCLQMLSIWTGVKIGCLVYHKVRTFDDQEEDAF